MNWCFVFFRNLMQCQMPWQRICHATYQGSTLAAVAPGHDQVALGPGQGRRSRDTGAPGIQLNLFWNSSIWWFMRGWILQSCCVRAYLLLSIVVACSPLRPAPWVRFVWICVLCFIEDHVPRCTVLGKDCCFIGVFSSQAPSSWRPPSWCFG